MIKDLTGQRFGRLTVLQLAPKLYRSPCGSCCTLWICRCDCGAEVILDRRNLTSGRTRSCGCLRKENCRRIAEARRRTTPPPPDGGTSPCTGEAETEAKT